MTRVDYQNRLSNIDSAIVCGLTITYDTGFEFTVLTSEGAYTDLGNYACWPCSEYKVSDELRELQKKLLNGAIVSDEELLENDFFKDACTFYNPIEGTWLVEGEKLKNILKALRVELVKLDLLRDALYSYIRLEDGIDDVFLFATKDELRALFFEYYKESVFPYSKMEDLEVEDAYKMADEVGWDAIPVFSSYNENDTTAE